MAETVEAGKDAAQAPAAKGSPEEMLKQAIGSALGERPAPAPAPKVESAPTARRALPRLGPNTRMGLAAGIALACGLAVGLTAAPRDRSGEALAQLRAGIEGARVESARLAGDIDRLARTTSALREAAEAARGEAKGLNSGVTDRIARLEQSLDRRIAGLTETVTQAEREHGTRIAGLAAQIEKKAQAAAAPAPRPEPKPEPKEARTPDPVQTGSLPDKPKAEAVEGWALRDVYDGVAILEDRRRRLVEVGTGDAVPGVGRVEAIERRGRNWVVVTRQGLITPQAW